MRVSYNIRRSGNIGVYWSLIYMTSWKFLQAGEVCKLYKNDEVTDVVTCPTHVGLHATYEIGHVDNFFTGVIDEVAFYAMAVGEDAIGR